jgi:hypothetical protein
VDTGTDATTDTGRARDDRPVEKDADAVPDAKPDAKPDSDPRRAREALVALANVVNLSTPLGLAVAVAGRARLSRGPRGMLLGTSYRLSVPPAVAFTVGGVILTRLSRDDLLARPRLVAHEERHTWQYAACLGLPMLPLYLLACGWSWLRCRDFASANVFERMAGLADGGYQDRRQPRPPTVL